MNIFKKISNQISSIFNPKIIPETKPEPEPEPNHLDILQEKMKIIAHTDKFPKFMHWIIGLIYGTYFVSASGNTSLLVYSQLSSLYQDWWYSGIKPPKHMWDNLKLKATSAYESNLIECAENVDIAYIGINDFCYYIADYNMLSIKLIQQTQIDKLDELINDDDREKLYTFADYDKE